MITSLKMNRIRFPSSGLCAKGLETITEDPTADNGGG